MPICIVHIGDIKSGTTSIQAALRAGNIPSVGPSLSYECVDLNHNYLDPIFRNGTRRKSSHIQDLRRNIRKTPDAEFFVISAERLSTIKPDVVKLELEACIGDLVSGFRIVHYIRPHFSRTISAYSEQVKIGRTRLDLKEFVRLVIRKRRLIHFPRVSAWQATFGDQYTVRPMVPEILYRGNVVTDFFKTVLGGVPADWSPPPRVNASLTASGIPHAMQLQARLEGKHTALRHAIGYEFEERYSKSAHAVKDPIRLDADTADRLFAARQEDALSTDTIVNDPFLTDALAQELSKFRSDAVRREDRPSADEAREMDEMIRKLAELADTPDEVKLAKKLRRARFERYISMSRPVSATV